MKTTRKQNLVAAALVDLLNVRAPELDGLELQQALAAADRQLPIVFVTGHGDIPISM